MAISLVSAAEAVGVAVLAGVGVAGITLSIGLTTPVGPGAWIDAPASGAVVAPGELTVLAHASERSGVPDAELVVDGHHVATASGAKSSDGTLALFSFPWTATAGAHEIGIETSTGFSSRLRTVFVSLGATRSPAPAPTPTQTPTASPSPTPIAPAPAPAPVTPTPVGPPAPAAPTVGRPTPTADVSWCGGATNVSVVATHATAVTIVVAPGGPTLVATNASGTWTARVRSGDLPPADFDIRDSYTLTASATGPGGRVQSSPGTLTMDDCKP